MLGLAAVLTFGGGAEAQVQVADTVAIDTVYYTTRDSMATRVDTTHIGSLFDLGAYGGGAWSTDWFKVGDEGYGVGFSPIFGLTSTLWARPTFGVRLHGAYMPSKLPQAEDEIGGGGWPVNNWFYDMDLVFRPWFTSDPGFMGGTYFFLGGGGLTTNVAGNPTPPGGVGFPCVSAYRPFGVCLSQDPEYASVGQGVVGAGFDLLPLASGVGLFGEVAVHGYDSPAHVFGNQAEDKFAFTPRAVLGVKFMFGSHTEVNTTQVPIPIRNEEVIRGRRVEVCVRDNNEWRIIPTTVRETRRDTVVVVDGHARPLREVFRDTSTVVTTTLSSKPWFTERSAIEVDGIRYSQYGKPENLTEAERQALGKSYEDIPLFTKVGDTETVGRYRQEKRWPKRIYLPLDAGCTFQRFAVLQAVG